MLTLGRSTSKEPEHSITLRLIILAAMLTPLIAIGRMNGYLWPHLIVAAVGIGVGHWHSYQNLAKNSQLVRGIMFIAIHIAFLWMCVGLFAGYTVPQAQFAVFAQAITSFDLRYRRSLFNTLIHSLANLYIAASLSRDFELGLYLILFAVLVLAAFFVAERDSGWQQAKLRPRLEAGTYVANPILTHKRQMTLFGLSFGAVTLVGIVLTFVVTPRFANNPIVPPFSLNIPLHGGVKSEIINPGLPLVQINGWSNEVGDYFFGFDSNLDLRYRGGLSDRIVMYVRSPSRGYWRSHSYDFYDGLTWGQSDQTLREAPGGGVYFRLEEPLGAPLEDAARRQDNSVSAQRIVQSFTLVADQPNLVFAAYRPKEIFMAVESVSVDSGDGLRLPEKLKAGITYSVVSERPEFDPERLRQAPTHYPPQIANRYLQLPANISNRVKNLARQLTAPYDNPYDQVLALTNHLLSEYPYNFFPPPHPPGAEVVDTFLFEDQEGFCEQYVAALVVMARILGIPARLTAGYGAGDYNPITNYYEVRYSHAHSWAEVYFPEYGWVPFDPTPGWTPQPYPTPAQNWLFANGSLLDLDWPGAPVGAMVSRGVAGLTFVAPFLIGAAFLAGLALLGLFLAQRLRGRLTQRKAKGYTSLAADPTRRLILKLYRQAIKLLARRNHPPPEPWETPGEYARRVGDSPSLIALTRTVEVAAYRPTAPDQATVAEAKAALESLRMALRNIVE